jgi:nicotinamidase-related amidase
MNIESKKTAVLSLDIQQGILEMYPSSKGVLPAAVQVVEAARKSGCYVFHVGIGFEPGYPEISLNHPRFSKLRERGVFIKGSESAQVHPSIIKSDESLIYKHRVSAFSGNALQMILQSKGIDTLVLFGIATSGIVLSTLRMAADLDYKCIIIKDACMDSDPEVHRVLTEKVFANQATIVTAKEFAGT